MDPVPEIRRERVLIPPEMSVQEITGKYVPRTEGQKTWILRDELFQRTGHR